jgi:hypothetical protein
VWQTEDRNFVWSSAKNYEHCALYRNKPPEGWWIDPLRCFDSGVQVWPRNITVFLFFSYALRPPLNFFLQLGFPAAIAASGEYIRTKAVSLPGVPFRFRLTKNVKEYVALKGTGPNWFSPFEQSADSHDDDDDDYSIDGWGVDSSPAKAVDANMNVHVAPASSDTRGVLRVHRDSDAGLHRDQILWHKDTSNFRQVQGFILLLLA